MPIPAPVKNKGGRPRIHPLPVAKDETSNNVPAPKTERLIDKEIFSVSYSEILFREGLQVAMKCWETRNRNDMDRAILVAEMYVAAIKERFPK